MDKPKVTRDEVNKQTILTFSLVVPDGFMKGRLAHPRQIIDALRDVVWGATLWALEGELLDVLMPVLRAAKEKPPIVQTPAAPTPPDAA